MTKDQRAIVCLEGFHVCYDTPFASAVIKAGTQAKAAAPGLNAEYLQPDCGIGGISLAYIFAFLG